MARALTFPQKKRLRRATEYSRIRREGRVYRGELVTIAVRHDPDASTFRAGFITSRKIGNAVQRNRVRRRLREIVRKNQFALRNNIWLLTIAQTAAARASYRVLEDEWLRLAKRASILARS